MLNEVAFDSPKSQAVYMEIKNIRQNIEDKKSGVNKKKTAPSKKQKVNDFDKENDWYYQKKMFLEELDKK